MGGVALEGGAMTSTTFVHKLILCMAYHPEVQLRAQAEVDKVVGTERMPKLNDVESMPYVQAVIKEIHRFYPAAPLAIPHSNANDESVGLFLRIAAMRCS